MVSLLDKPAGIYRPRKPQESDFHRLIREHFTLFSHIYAGRYARNFGFWRPVIHDTVSEFLKCGATMKIIAFIEARQTGVIEAILRHNGLWQGPAPRAPPAFPMPAAQPSALTVEMDPDYIEHLHAEETEIAFQA